MTGIATALAAAQQNMGKALKQASNPHLKSKYADLGSVMEACLPALNAAGIAVIQPTGQDELGLFVETMLIHGESGERLSCRVPLMLQKNDMQGFGSAVTYARRYGLMSMAGIAPEDDDGNAASSRPTPAAQAAAPAPRLIAPTAQAISEASAYLKAATSIDDLKVRWGNVPADVRLASDVTKAKDEAKAALLHPVADEIPY